MTQEPDAPAEVEAARVDFPVQLALKLNTPSGICLRLEADDVGLTAESEEAAEVIRAHVQPILHEFLRSAALGVMLFQTMVRCKADGETGKVTTLGKLLALLMSGVSGGSQEIAVMADEALNGPRVEVAHG